MKDENKKKKQKMAATERALKGALLAQKKGLEALASLEPSLISPADARALLKQGLDGERAAAESAPEDEDEQRARSEAVTSLFERVWSSAQVFRQK